MDYNKVISLVYDARKIALNSALKNNIKSKSSFDFVTEVDFQISDFIKKGLSKIAPKSSFVTEEESEHKFSNDRFILDPIDGTTNLIRETNLSTISLAHFKDGEIVFGVVFNPFSKQMWFALKGKGAYYYSTTKGINDLISIGIENYSNNKLSVTQNECKKAIVEFGAGASHKEFVDDTFKLGKQVFIDCGDFRRICSTALSLCYIASGKIDGYFDRKIKVWDYSAGSLILQEAGGILSQWNGDKLTFNEDCSIIAGNKNVYTYLKQTINKLFVKSKDKSEELYYE